MSGFWLSAALALSDVGQQIAHERVSLLKRHEALLRRLSRSAHPNAQDYNRLASAVDSQDRNDDTGHGRTLHKNGAREDAVDFSTKLVTSGACNLAYRKAE